MKFSPAKGSQHGSQRLKHFLSRPRKTACPWAGEHAGPPVAAVDIARSCGHNEGKAIPTCIQHLNTLLSTAGVAPTPTPCTICGKIGAPRVIDTQDLD